MKPFSDIFLDSPNVEIILNNHQHYWAHTHPDKEQELFSEHIKLVNEYSLLLIKAHGLENVIDKLILDYVREWPDNSEAAKWLKVLFAHVFVFHDFGKVNENFQVLRMRNITYFKENFRTILKPIHGHSFLSTFLYISYHIDLITKTEISDRTKQRLICHCFFIGYSILKHHSSALFDASSTEYLNSLNDLFEVLEVYVKQYGLNPDKEMLNGILRYISDIWNSELEENANIISFPLYALIKLNFSVLTAADYLATHEYMNSSRDGKEAKTSDFGVFNNKERIKSIIHQLKSFKHNKKSFSNIENYVFTHPKENSNDNLNRLREEMTIELIQTVRKNINKKLFYIEAPTGGGKTNLSIITITELLEANPELNKVFYVFPFTTLITQTYKTLKETLGLMEHELIELHSKAGVSSKSDEEQKDGVYGNEKKDYIDNLFALYPVTLLSHVKFFDILKTNRKEDNYLLHRLANSIVIIDEIQSYNPLIWDKMFYFISQYSKYFNVRFVLMSATLPKISDLNIGLTQKPIFIELLPNARKYITNTNFSERVTFNFELFKEDISLEDLTMTVIKKSNAYISKNKDVRTIIEFIYKKSASKFQQAISAMKHPFDQIFVLSGTILEPRRREIINYIKRTAKSNISILLITTQVVEAGVDIDMDLGFKNTSLIDSDEQLAGRVNRNAFKKDCEVYLFKMDDARILYGKDYRYQQTKEKITIEDHKQILKEKDFRKLYENVIEVIDTQNIPEFKDSFPNYEKDLHKLRFGDVDKNFKIIDQANNSVYVPMKIPTIISGSEEEGNEEIISAKEIDFLKQFGAGPIGDLLDGAQVWKAYESLINSDMQKRQDKWGFDIKGEINFKILQSIMSKFTFSLMTNSKDYQRIRDGFGEEKFGYMYFSHWDEERTDGKAYSYDLGLNSSAFSDAMFI